MTCKIDTWTGCYDLGWGDLLVPASYSHPAKMSRSLVFKIVAHALEEKWIQPGQWILDPFGGVGTTALPTLMAGLNYIGVELEQKFVELGRENINLWNSRFSGMPKWTGQAKIIQGDSRRLVEVVRGAGIVVSSPPYATINPEKNGSGINIEKQYEVYRASGGGQSLEAFRSTQLKHSQGYGSTEGQLSTLPPGDIQAVIASPPFAGNSGGRGEASRNGIDAALFDRHSGGMKKGTGSDPANLDHLPMGAPPAIVVSSPPYVDSMEKSGGIDPDKSNHVGGPHSQMNRSDTRYGEADGQLGAMKGGEISAIIASPPFADSVGSDDPARRGGLFRDEKRRNDTNLTGTYGETDGQLGGMKAGAVISSPPFENGTPHNGGAAAFIEDKRPFGDYGSTAGQIGATQGDTFWAAARLIVEQCALLLPPGGVVIWVLKDYIKAGKIVPFALQWQQLCEACGFETVHIHRAMLVKDNGEQETMAPGHDTTGTTTNLLGEEVTTWGKPMLNKKNRTQRKSFFRLLAEKKGAPPIDYESVLCTRKAV